MAKQQSNGSKAAGSWLQRNEMAVVLALMVVSLAVIVIFIAPDLIGGGAVTPGNASEFGVNIISAGTSAGMAECLSNNGISLNTLVYVYSDTCSYSQANTPWVMDLISQGYSVFLVNTANVSAMNIVSSCLGGVAQLTGTPEFICPTKRETRVDAFSSEVDLKDFADSCK